MKHNYLHNLYTLEGKVAIVTGGTGLIGKYHCRALAGAGATVIITDLSDSACTEFAETLNHVMEEGMPGSAHGFATDVTDKKSLMELKERILSEFGSIDILVNNAAINDMFENPATAGEQSKFENYPVELLQKSLDVNVTGTFLCAQVFGSEMASAGKGSIINIASTYGIVGPDQSIYKNPDGSQNFYKSAAYPITKGAVISFTKFLAAYWGSAGVRINTLSPGGVENNQDAYFIKNYTTRTPLGRMATPDDYQGALIFLASDASRYMTGANLVVDGGWTCW